MQVIKHQMELTTYHRARDQHLEKMITETMAGELSPETEKHIMQLSRPLSPELQKNAIHLHPTNVHVAFENSLARDRHPCPPGTEPVKFKSEEQGDMNVRVDHVEKEIILKVIYMQPTTVLHTLHIALYCKLPFKVTHVPLVVKIQN